MSHHNCVCIICRNSFHWCISCGLDTAIDHARDEGYCSVQCAIQHNPNWQPKGLYVADLFEKEQNSENETNE
jgi:hypothetical protein